MPRLEILPTTVQVKYSPKFFMELTLVKETPGGVI